MVHFYISNEHQTLADISAMKRLDNWF